VVIGAFPYGLVATPTFDWKDHRRPNDMMNLRILVEKAPDADLLRKMIGFAAALYGDGSGRGDGAAYGEKRAARHDRRHAFLLRSLPRKCPLAQSASRHIRRRRGAEHQKKMGMPAGALRK